MDEHTKQDELAGDAVEVHEPQALVSAGPIGLDELRRREAEVKEMVSGMEEGVHYGKIPGIKGLVLYKAGADYINRYYNVRPRFKIQKSNLKDDHREYEVVTQLIDRVSGVVVGEGVGSCSTMEPKYRYRTGPMEWSETVVPGDYWTLRKTDPHKAQKLLGGPGYMAKKHWDEKKYKGKKRPWVIVKRGERIENTDPADQWNTVLKMAKKRSSNDGSITISGATSYFPHQDTVDERMEVDENTQLADDGGARNADFGKAKVKKNGAKKELGKDAGKLFEEAKQHLGTDDQETVANLLQALTAFEGDKGPVPGVRSFFELSEKRAYMARIKLARQILHTLVFEKLGEELTPKWFKDAAKVDGVEGLRTLTDVQNAAAMWHKDLENGIIDGMLK